MKPSTNLVEALSDIGRFEEGPQLRRIGGEMLLALARKEIPAADVEAGAKMVAAISAHWATQLRQEAQAEEMRTKLRLIGKQRDE